MHHLNRNNSSEDLHSHSHSRGGYPPPPPPNPSQSNTSSRPSFPSLHHLPPPIPSAGSPLGHYPASPSYRDSLAQSPSGGHTDPQTWASGHGMDRPSSGRGKPTWSLGPSPRSSEPSSGGGGGGGGGGSRLPSLVDIPYRGPSGWDAPSPGSYAMSNARGAGPGHHYHPSSYRDSPSRPPPLITPVSSTSSVPHGYHPDDRPPSPSMTHRGSIASQGGLGGGDRPEHVDSPSAASNKHSAPTGDSDGAPQQKKKKRRVALSCAECAKRKQKCNRETPCQHCVARRVPELCVPYSRPATPPGGKVKTEAPGSVRTPPKDKKDSGGERPTSQPGTGPRPPSMLPTISVRVARLEAMMNAVINRVEGVEGKALNDWRINHAPATTPPPLSAELPSEDNTDKLGDRPETASTRSRRDDRSVEWEMGGETEDAVVGGLDRDTSSRNPLPQSMIISSGPVPRGLDYHGTPAEQLQKLFEDCGVSPHKVPKLLKDLPPRHLTLRLVDWFFSKVNYVRYPIDEHLFRSALEVVYSGTSSASLVLALPLIFIVLALSIRVAPDDYVGPEDQKRTMSLKMYWNSKQAIMLASAVKAENLHLVETRICSGLYLILMHERRLAEGWAEFRAALTIGEAIGLHRDGSKLSLDPYVTEYRRRLWSYLVHADATYSCLLGRPTSINESCTDTLPPSNLNLDDLKNDKTAVAKPMTEPTFATYLILRGGLGRLVAKVTQHFQRLQGQTSYRDVEALDAEFKQFVEDLPPTFRMLTPDKSYDNKMWFLPIHRYYIQTEILHFTIILHRPWLLRKLRSSRHALSRAACFEAAITDYKLRQAFKIDCPDFFETLLGGSFREFNAAMIAGISILIDPRAAHAGDMKQIVQSFMEQHPHDPKADDFSQKEAAIIYTLHQRAQEMEERRNQRRNSSLVPSGGRLSHDNTSFERSSKSMPAPPVPTPPLSGEHSASNSAEPKSVPLPAISPQSYVRASPYAPSMGPTPPGMGTSPEDDHPQRLLDNWLVQNTSFGPGSDSTMNFNIGPYHPSQVPIGIPGMPGHHPQMAQSVPMGQTSSRPGGVSVPGAAGGGGEVSFGGFDQPGVGAMGWMDPSLVGAPQMMPGSGGEMVQGPGGPIGPLGGQAGVGGNSTQYWNALIDGEYELELERGWKKNR
ncbi:nuclear protein [Kwoniella heveanensis CBS 569]|nr:nuclear protein [Kwoniella heveanensis CBS 569]